MKQVDWHHAPLHRFIPGRIHMITGATLNKQHFFIGNDRLALMQRLLLERMEELGWEPRAWSCLSNHYHLLAVAPEEEGLTQLIRGFHSKLSIAVNKMDHVSGRKVMHQYWDRCVSFEDSYYARLHYVMTNPVKHGVTKDAETYPFCSAKWFRETHGSAFRRKVFSYRIDKVSEVDDF